MAVRAQRVPAVAILAFVARDVLFVRVQGPVRSGVCHMQKEFFVLSVISTIADILGIGGVVLIQHLDGVVGDGVGEVVAGRIEL